MSQPVTARRLGLISHQTRPVFLLLALVILSLLTARPAQAQYGGWSAVPCDAQGVPLQYTNTDGNGFYVMGGTESWQTDPSGYPKPMVAAALANPGYYGYGYYLNAIGLNGFALTGSDFSVYGGLGYASGTPLSARAYNNDNYGDGGLYQVPDSYGTPSTGLINGSDTQNVTGQLVYYFLERWNGYGPPTSPMPDHVNLLLKTDLWASANVYYGSSGQTSGLSAQATATDGPPYNETATASAGDASVAPGPSHVSGYHLVRASVDPNTGIAEAYLNGQMTWKASNTVPFGVLYQPYPNNPSYVSLQQTNGPTEAEARGLIQCGVKQDDRAVKAFTPGHTPTFHKEGYLTDPNGNQILDNYGYPIGKPVQNVPVGNALQVDIGVPVRNYTYDTVNTLGYAPPPDTSGSAYEVEYDGLVHGGPYYPNWADNGTDTYNWYSSHTGRSDGATLPHVVGLGDYSIFPFPITYNAPYVLKTLYGDPTQDTVQLCKQDADGSQIDHINLHYHFSKDGADATYNLYPYLHTLHENWVLENTYTELPTNTPNAPATQLSCNPSPQTGGHPTIYTRSALPRVVQYSGGSLVLGVAVAGQLLEPEVNAFLAATGVGLQQVLPQPTTESLPDGLSDYRDAKERTLAGVTGLMTPPQLATFDAVDDDAYQGGCTYELWERVYNKRYAWVGDKYGNNGYVGPDTWFTTEPWSRPIEHRYTLVTQPPNLPGPGQ